MSNQTLKSFQALRVKQKQRVNEWLFKEILLYCIHHQEEMDEQEKKRLAQRFCDRVRALSAQISEEDALKIIEKRLPGMLERARNETEQRSQLLPSFITSSDERLSSRQKWAQDFSCPIGSGDSLIKGYKRQFGLDRVNAMKELQSMGYVFPQKVIDRQYRIVETEKQQKAAKKKKRKMRKQESEFIREDQDDRFFYIAGYTSGGAPYGLTWEEMGMKPYEDMDDGDVEDELTDE